MQAPIERLLQLDTEHLLLPEEHLGDLSSQRINGYMYYEFQPHRSRRGIKREWLYAV